MDCSGISGMPSKLDSWLSLSVYSLTYILIKNEINIIVEYFIMYNTLKTKAIFFNYNWNYYLTHNTQFYVSIFVRDKKHDATNIRGTVKMTPF